MVGCFDFVKAGRFTADVLKRSRDGARKIVSAASVELERLTKDETNATENFSAANDVVELVNTKQEGDNENGSV